MESVNKDLIYGFFEIERDGDMVVKRWHPSPMVGLSAKAQYEHNRRIDPEFAIVQIREQHLEVA